MCGLSFTTARQYANHGCVKPGHPHNTAPRLANGRRADAALGLVRAPGVPDAPTHASLVKAKCGEGEPRRPRPNPNRGDNLTGPSPYQDSDPELAAEPPLVR
jgi:hypothetical protein